MDVAERGIDGDRPARSRARGQGRARQDQGRDDQAVRPHRTEHGEPRAAVWAVTWLGEICDANYTSTTGRCAMGLCPSAPSGWDREAAACEAGRAWPRAIRASWLRCS